jgi:hypothetical protein
MKKIKSLKGQRYFIWAIVISVVGLGGLATYIYSVSADDASAVEVSIPSDKQVLTSPVVFKLPITQAEALGMVKNLPGVKAFVAREGSKAHIFLETQVNSSNPASPYWSAHVYQDQNGQITTFAWYKVYSKTGMIQQQ